MRPWSYLVELTWKPVILYLGATCLLTSKVTREFVLGVLKAA